MTTQYSEINLCRRPLPKMMQLKKRRDKYCWECHKPKVDLFCSNCPRAFHFDCVDNCETEAEHPKNLVCHVCNISYLGPWMGKEKLAELLFHVLLKCKAVALDALKDINVFKMVISANSKKKFDICLEMDLDSIEYKNATFHYLSTFHFLSDVYWIRHNCYVCVPSDEHPLVKSANEIAQVALQEIDLIKTCADCYKNVHTIKSKDYFIEPCLKPHRLVWAKTSGYPFWPAKVVRYNEHMDSVKVIYFQDHTESTLKTQNCLMISEEYPCTTIPKTAKFKTACEELMRHIQKLNQQFPGWFKYEPSNAKLNPNDIYYSHPTESL